MSTLGDLLADVGLFLYWATRAQIIATGSAIDEKAGFLSDDEIVARYAEKSGRVVGRADFVVACALLAIIVEGIHARFKMGKTLGEGFDSMGETVTALVHGALQRRTVVDPRCGADRGHHEQRLPHLPDVLPVTG